MISVIFLVVTVRVHGGHRRPRPLCLGEFWSFGIVAFAVIFVASAALLFVNPRNKLQAWLRAGAGVDDGAVAAQLREEVP